MSINGFYAGFFTGLAGNGIAIFAINNGIICGVDGGGVFFDGEYKEDTAGTLSGLIRVKVPGGGTIIQGITAPPQGLSYEVPLKMPRNFVEQPYIAICTPFGDVNVRMQKLREI